MGESTHDIFGDTPGAQPAIPGSYGVAPAGYRLPSGTHLGPVRLQVADMTRSLAYYERTLGMRQLRRDGAVAVLGATDGGGPLVELQEHAGARPVPRRGRLGLFHFAILLPDDASLGRLLRHLGELGERLGMSDHLVSQSLYLHDPDNLGIEVYADRPRSAWRRVGRELMMATDPLDVDGLLHAARAVPWSGMPAATVMGHVHLHVGDLEVASAFYSGALGFDRMVWQYPGALFLAADGYHHHLGTNTWAGSDAPRPAVDEAQLLEWTIELPDSASLDAVSENLRRAGAPAQRVAAAERSVLLTHDPWGTHIRLRAATQV